MRKVVFLLVVVVCSVAAFGQQTTEGSLFAVGKTGKDLGACPLKNTSVKTEISGFLARVRVKQEFENSFTVPIEAVYTFPLSHNGAVDDMKMTVGERVIRGKIMKREEARQVYEAAKSEGKTASLLDQERPNIFTQAVANIMPGEKVIVEISYVETLKYEDGAYEFVFPMVVAPRYIPGSVKDAAKVSPPVAAERPGHDVSIEVSLNAGVPVEEIRSSSHDIEQVNFSPSVSKITLKDAKTIPNKDFVLRFDVTGKRIEDALLAHRDERGGFFTMILQPPDKFASEDRTPKEIVFVLDTSGSMSGFPIEKAKEAMKLSLDGLYPDDTFNLITFAGSTAILFDEPVPATQANFEKAQSFLAERRGYGGTEMMTAIKAALEPSDAQDHLRIVCFMTDGEVGNDDEIIAEVQKHPKARVFSFGIGSSVNRSLLDKIAQEGNGEAEYVALTDDGSKAAKKFYERVRTPLLTDLSIDWNGMPVADIYPNKLSDLFTAKPVVVHGRYTKAGSGTIKLKGYVAGQPYEREITVNLPETESANDVLATLWARNRIDQISADALKTVNSTNVDQLNKQITNLGLEFRLMTQFTSFVAVENKVVNYNGKPVTKEVPVALPEGMDRRMVVDGVSAGDVDEFGAGKVSTTSKSKSRPVAGRPVKNYAMLAGTILPSKASARSKSGSGSGSGMGSGNGNGNGSGSGYATGSVSSAGYSVSETVAVTSDAPVALPPPPATIGNPKTVSGGVLNGKANTLPKPDYPVAAYAQNAIGAVSVQVTVDENGKVISASAVSGHPLLRNAAEKAARAAEFHPTMLSGKPVKFSGVITYNFGNAGASAGQTDGETLGIVAVPADAAVTPEQAKRRILSEKLYVWLFEMAERLAKGDSKPGANEAKFVRDGKAEIQIELTVKSAEVLEKLKAAGFEVVSEKGKTFVAGRINIDKLSELALIEEVKLILPKI